MLNLVMNNRDHRKIMVIDGQIAFTGGVNLADEYINKIVRFGYWKDSGVRLDGPGAASLANIFLTFWKAKYPDEDLDAGCDLPAAVPVETDCLVQPLPTARWTARPWRRTCIWSLSTRRRSGCTSARRT